MSDDFLPDLREPSYKLRNRDTYIPRAGRRPREFPPVPGIVAAMRLIPCDCSLHD